MSQITEGARKTIAHEMGKVAAKRQTQLMDGKTHGATQQQMDAMIARRDNAYAAAVEVGSDLAFVNAWIVGSPDTPKPATFAS